MKTFIYYILKSILKKQLKFRPPLVHTQVLKHKFVVRGGDFGSELDYNDAWLMALASRAKTAFDIGAHIGKTAFLILLPGSVNEVVLVEPNPEALAIAAENLICNGLSGKARFIPALAGENQGSFVKFWTFGCGEVGSIYQSHAKTAVKLNSFIYVPVITIDSLCDSVGIIPDLINIDVEGAEHKVLMGSKRCAAHKKSRLLVEMHSNEELTMTANSTNVIEWCKSVGYQAWYMAQGVKLDNPEEVQNRGRCHILLQPLEWPYPGWLKEIKESARLEDAISS